ncbi:MAG: porphobilinogen synthase [Rhabdochlamydiaceae bacterium]
MEDYNLPLRLRRMRSTSSMRDLIRETYIHPSQLILPLFLKGEKGDSRPIPSLIGHEQLTLETLLAEVKLIDDLGLKNIILFGVPSYKDSCGSESFSDEGIIQKGLRLIKQHFPHLLVMADVCLCEYTDHGHCGVLNTSSTEPTILNDLTLFYLAKQAISYAEAGADVLAPSGMMDGAVSFLRSKLDAAGFSHLPILSYAVKYQSALYGPFREAAEGSPRLGDRKNHQLDPANAQEAIREIMLDVEEGADMLMVKPAHTYLDIICRVKQAFPYVPLGAYHTSGEFAMIKAAAKNGWIDEQETVKEVILSIKRAGADFIITYFAKDIAFRLKNGSF